MAKEMTYLYIATLLAYVYTIVGCASTPIATAVTPPKYELLLSGSLDGAAFQGMAMGSSASSHQITIQSSIAVNYFMVESCHRAQQFNNIISEPWYTWVTETNTQGFNWTYTEAPTIEDTGDCPLRFCAFSNTVGSPPSACAVVDFHSAKYTLPATNICNGVTGDNTGSSMCHTETGLLERIQFQGPVDVAPQVVDPTGNTPPYWIPGQCVGSFVDTAQTLWQYTMPANECTVIFMEKVSPYRRAKLLVIPYNTALYGGS